MILGVLVPATQIIQFYNVRNTRESRQVSFNEQCAYYESCEKDMPHIEITPKVSSGPTFPSFTTSVSGTISTGIFNNQVNDIRAL